MAVASNNIVSLSKDQKLFNAEKNLFHAQTAMEEHKLISEQEEVVNFNRAIIYLKMGKVCGIPSLLLITFRAMD